jgi:inner membrane transporter RhtA
MTVSQSSMPRTGRAALGPPAEDHSSSLVVPVRESTARAAGEVVQADAAQGRLTSAALGCSVAAGVLASVVPYAADLVALRFVPARFFSVFMSVHAVLAALVGTIVLRQFLGVHEWIGIAMVVLTNAAAVTTSRGADADSTAGEGTPAERSPMAAAGARSAG